MAFWADLPALAKELRRPLPRKLLMPWLSDTVAGDLGRIY